MVGVGILAACTQPAQAPSPPLTAATRATAAPGASPPTEAPADPCSSVSAFRTERALPPAAVGDNRAAIALARAYLTQCGATEVIALTRDLVRFPTVSSREEPASGPSFRAMAAHLQAWAARHGLEMSIEGPNDAWEIGFGAGKPELAFVLHADVVPAGGEEPSEPGALPAGWTHPPFAATLAGGRLYGRGTEDDKGPIAAVLVVLASLHGAGFEPAGRVLAIIGTGEESAWEGMERYVGTHSPPQQTVSVDSTFPVVIGENGFVAWHLALPVAKAPKSQRATIVAARGGAFLTQVPGDATMTLAPAKNESVQGLLARAVSALAAERKAREAAGGRFEMQAELDPEGTHVVIRTLGQAVHSSVADSGHNALWPLAAVARRLRVERQGTGAMLDLIAQKLDGDHHGVKLGLAYEHPFMGKLLVAPTMLSVNGDQVTLGLNLRRPAGLTSAEFASRLDVALVRLRREVDARLTELPGRYVGEAHLVEAETPLVSTLLEVYRQETGDASAQPVSLRGGTYARLFPGAVSFGPSFPGRPYRGHAPDEYVEVEDLATLTRLLFAAASRLAANGSAAVP